MKSGPVVGVIGIAIVVLSCATDPFAAARRRALTADELAQCTAKDGFASRAPFGDPICQIPYADAQKICAADEDCLGRCLLTLDGPPGNVPKIGDAATGRCEAQHSTFGCYATVDGGKISEGGMCVD